MDGACNAFTPAQGGGPDNFEVGQGSTYRMTISGITECEGDTITVFVQSSQSGNFCFPAYGGSGEYSGTFTVPNPACQTMPVSYKCGAEAECKNKGAFRVQGPTSGCGGVHLRAAEFNGGCQLIGTDNDCMECREPASAKPLDGKCTAQLSVSPPIQGGTSTASYDGDHFGGVALFYYSHPADPIPYMGCDIYLGMPAFLGAMTMLDGNGDAMVSVSNRQHPCGQQLMIQAFGIDMMGAVEVSNAVLITFGS